VGAEVLDPDLLGLLLDDRPDGPVAQPVFTEATSLPYGPEQFSLINAGRRRPDLDSLPHPDRHRHRPDPSTLAEEIGDYPSALPHLDVLYI
jgi:hypothetical protein